MKIRTHIIVFTLVLATSVAFAFGGSGEFGKFKLMFQKLKWSILPKSTESISLGSASKKFKEAHIKDLYVEHVAGDTIVETVSAGVNLTNSGTAKNPILDVKVSEDVDMDTVYQLINLQAPAADGEAIRQTSKISESILEASKDKIDGIEDNATADQSDTEVEDLLAGLTGDDRLSSDSLREGATNLFVTSTQEADWQATTDKVDADSAIWDAAAAEVNADSAVWEDKYTVVEVDAKVDDLDTAKYDSPTVDTLLDDKVALADSALVQHNDLLGKQGGTAGEYYHMTAAQHGEIGNWQTATDKIEDDSDYWDLMCDKVNDDSAIWADKYTQAQITAYLALKFDVADSTIFVWKDGSQDFTADQSMGGFTLTHLDEPAADSEPATKYYADQGLAGKQATGNYLEDGDFGSNGLMKRTGAGAYSIVTDNSTYWGQMSDKVASDSPNWDAAYTLKGVLDALNGIMKCDGAGNYSIITDLSTYWTQMSDEVASDSPNWDDAYSKRVVTWTSPLVFSSNTASIPAATNTVNGYMPAAFVIALEQDDIEELTPVNAVASQGTITMSGIAIADETFVIDSQTFTWKASRSGAGEVTIGADAPAAVTNIVTAVTADLATVTAVDGDGDTVTVTAVTKGVAGNSLVFTEASTNMVVDGAGTLGTTVAGVDGTVGIANELAADANYLYHCVDTNTIADDNWRRISLGSAY